jgi:hypothetical protein
MLRLVLDVVLALLIYLIPGIIVLDWVGLRDLRGINRLVVALALSMVIVPVTFILIGNIIPFQPGLFAWLILVVLLIGVSFLLRYRGLRGQVRLGGASETGGKPSWVEIYGVYAFLIAFAAFTNLPRILMIFKGGQALDLGPWDETWHIAELISVARTGIPPTHYYFPSLQLGYYYGSWILPAILGNLPGSFSVSLLRAMGIHVFIQIFTFLGLVYVILQTNFKSAWVRLAGISLFTVMGGFDVFARLPKVDYVDWWQLDAQWLIGKIQISQFPTLFSWVPQHLAGGMVLLLLILIFKNTNLPVVLKLVSTSVLLAFCFMTSPFVFLALALATAIVFLAEWRRLWQNRTRTLGWLAIMAVLFLSVTWFAIFVYAGHNGKIIPNELRINIFERFRGNTSLNGFMDKTLTMLGLPLVGGFMLFIDMGLAFLIYLFWWGKRIISGKPLFNSTEEVLLGVFPPLCIILVFLYADQGGGGDLAMRGLIPTQILVVFAAVQVLGDLAGFVQNIGWRRWILVYVFLCFFVGQAFSTYTEVHSTSVKIVKLALWSDCGWGSLFRSDASYDDYCIGNSPLRYINWLNQYSPTNALILEMGPFPEDRTKYRWLERNRFLVPTTASQLFYFSFDMDFILPKDWNNLIASGPKTTNVLDWYKAINFRGKGTQPVYLVTRQAGQAPPQAGSPVYQDQYVKIYHLDNSILDQ